MSDHHHGQESGPQGHPWASPAMFGVVVIGIVFTALFCFLAYYGLKTTPFSPMQMMQ